MTPARRVRARVEGTVQGVGFRPFVYRLAAELALAGHVRNDERGVVLEVQGDPEGVERFLDRLASEPPPLALVERVSSEDLATTDATGFRILGSERSGEAAAPVSADTATCDDCLAELFDPRDRRHRYPFINCTNCGPRFTIVRGVPYDRPLTTMAGFQMCRRCQGEYDDPANRRFHAQPNACADCGPSARLVDRVGQAVEGVDDAIAAAADALRAGRILAVKGVGGFHLACRADDEPAVATLRARKHREEKPFAVMAPDLATASGLAQLEPEHEQLLLGRERPIVVAPRRSGADVAASVAPRSPDLGVMLPYSPLHHLLLVDVDAALVMTSGNVSDEPIAYRDEDALARLGPIADLFLVHDRPIETRTDDSVVRTVTLDRSPRRLMLRRSRGHVPDSLELRPPAERPVLACGAELKNAFCLVKGRRAWVGHHVGDLKNWETLQSFREGVTHFERLFAVEPEVVAHDLHPDYLSTTYALDREAVEHVGVQHHHAHLAACLAEHGEDRPAVGAIYDGTGYGADGSVWGGEILVGDAAAFERAGHLWPVRMPGGDRAVREPWRMACAWLVEASGPEPPLPPALDGHVSESRWLTIARLAGDGLASPVTTSVGRLFDAVAALRGLCPEATYEGQAAVELEAAASGAAGEAAGAYVFDLGGDGGLVIDARETVLAAARDAASGVSPGTVAARFHNGLADVTARACAECAERHGIDVVVLSGGVFQNRLLLERTAAALAGAGLEVLVPERLPPNDGGIAYGQAAVAARAAGAG
ncbi:MAG: carbamoyltransferase HypF [Thermoleophilaceae bacterium]|nr:carbamoyltransferase HypF [Thermoleophilaceae bacterium]